MDLQKYCTRVYIKLLLSIGYTKEEVQLYKLLKWPLFSRKLKTYPKITK
jgi:hypothetical protein